MIDEKKVAELRTVYKATEDAPESRIDLNAWEVIETLEALWKVAREAESFVSEIILTNEKGEEGLRPLKDALSALREREGRG